MARSQPKTRHRVMARARKKNGEGGKRRRRCRNTFNLQELRRMPKQAKEL